MKKEFLIKCIEDNMSSGDIAKLSGKAKTTVKYWLDKFELKTNHQSIKSRGVVNYGDNKHCPRCKTIKPLNEFYDKRGKVGGSGYCKKCTNEESGDRARKLKQQCVEYKGGCCEKCGYDKCNNALQFHHLNPTEKDFSISKLSTNSFNDKIRAELDKCIMVCANCHFEIHASLDL